MSSIFLSHLLSILVIVGNAATLFTGTLYHGYGYPDDFCFQCGDEPIKVSLFFVVYSDEPVISMDQTVLVELYLDQAIQVFEGSVAGMCS